MSVLIGILVFLGLSLLILGHEAGHFIAARLFGLKVDEFGFGFPPRITAWKRGETEYSLNWLPFGGFVKIAGENERFEKGIEALAALPEEETKGYFFSQGAGKRAVVVVAGVAMNLLIGWFLFAAIFMIGTPQTLVVGGIQERSPAEAAGIMAGDVFLDYQNAQRFIEFVDAHRGEEIELRVRRESEEMLFTVTPRVMTEENEGAVGVLLSEAGLPAHTPLAAVGKSFMHTVRIFGYTISSFYDLLSNLIARGNVPQDVAGPVGIFVIAQQTGELGFIYLIQLLALISVNLAVINLFPFPALDGGRFAMIIMEKIKGSPISIKTEAVVNGVGFIVLMLLIVSITVSDILKLL